MSELKSKRPDSGTSYEFETCDHCGGTGGLPTAQSLKHARGKIPQQVVADRMGVSQQYLSKLESGKRDWNYELISEFEKALRLPIS